LAKASARWLIRFFLPAVHLAEGDVMSVGLEDRVITMALLAAHRPDDAALNRAGKDLVMPVGPGEHQRAAEPCGAGLGRILLKRIVGAVIAMTKSRPFGVSAQSAV
jgi:hypothetical protein